MIWLVMRLVRVKLEITMKTEPPCRNCKNRKQACHDTCRLFADYRDRLQTLHQREKSDKEWGNYKKDTVDKRIK